MQSVYSTAPADWAKSEYKENLNRIQSFFLAKNYMTQLLRIELAAHTQWWNAQVELN